MNKEDFYNTAFRCPRCDLPFTPGRCSHCGTCYRQVLGIWDLQWPPQSAPPHTDEVIHHLVNAYESVSFEHLATYVRRQRFQDFEADLLDHLQERSRGLHKIGNERITMFLQRLSQHYSLPTTEVALDIGCGYGTTTAALAHQFELVVGIDPDLASLILARKYLDEQNITNVILVRASAQQLPLVSNIATYAVAHNVLEHLFDVEPALREARRVLQEEGCFCGDSRNRYDLLFPEPHVKLRWVGLMPRFLQPWYVNFFKKVSYEETHTRLLSWWELRRCARNAFGQSSRIVFPFVSAYGQSPRVDSWLSRLEGLPMLRDLVMWFFPSHLLLAQVQPTEAVQPAFMNPDTSLSLTSLEIR